jgi:hypothetical protein
MYSIEVHHKGLNKYRVITGKWQHQSSRCFNSIVRTVALAPAQKLTRRALL